MTLLQNGRWRSTRGGQRAVGVLLACLVGLLAPVAGCGTTKSQMATEQLLVSDAVDRAVSEIDFRDLAGQKVYFDTRYVQNIKGVGFVNSEYIISSLRQQMFAANCYLQETVETADYVVEARVGALGTDAHDVIYGLPANNALSSASQVVPGAPPLPAIPEISLARRNDQTGAAKLAVFAYHRTTKAPVWQSGISQSRSHAKDTWLFGAGPFQRGTIYEGTQFAGGELGVPLLEESEGGQQTPAIPYHGKVSFAHHFQGEEQEQGGEEKATFEGPPLPAGSPPAEGKAAPQKEKSSGKASAEAKPPVTPPAPDDN